MRTTVLLLLLLLAEVTWGESVTIRFVDPQSKSLTPVRVELIDSGGTSVTAKNAIPISRECAFAPLPVWLSQPPPNKIDNPFTGTQQHYVSGIGRYDLEAGTYRLRVFKGPEFEVVEQEFSVSNQTLDMTVEVNRWSDVKTDGWVSADTHLHLTRQSSGSDENITLWMAAEDLQIANLLQMGSLTHFAAAPQYAFGDAGTYFSNGTMLVPGQEHPRTHLFGHGISLGASSQVDERARYIQYNATFERVREAGGISGFAHWGAGPSRDGLALNVPLGNVELLEVLSFEFLYLDAWYELLNLGYTLVAVAGTDFPCLPSIPGRERTYLRIDNPLERGAIVDALRAGRTFVSNGPMLDLAIEGNGIGSKLELAPLDRVRVAGQIQYDPQQDAIHTLELVHNGETVRSWPVAQSGQFQFSEEITFANPGWVALRTVGRKVGETKPPARAFPEWMESAFSKWMSGGSSSEVDAFLESREWRNSYAHTSPIYISIQGEAKPNGRAEQLLVRLRRIEAMLKNQDIEEVWDWMPYSDGVGAEHLNANAPDLLIQVREAKEQLRQRVSAD